MEKISWVKLIPLILLPLDDDLHNHVGYKHTNDATAKIHLQDQRNHIRKRIDRGYAQVGIHGKATPNARNISPTQYNSILINIFIFYIFPFL